MDDKSVKYGKARYEEIKEEFSKYLAKVGYKPKKIPFIPISGWQGDNMIERSTNMDWCVRTFFGVVQCRWEAQGSRSTEVGLW